MARSQQPNLLVRPRPEDEFDEPDKEVSNGESDRNTSEEDQVSASSASEQSSEDVSL